MNFGWQMELCHQPGVGVSSPPVPNHYLQAKHRVSVPLLMDYHGYYYYFNFYFSGGGCRSLHWWCSAAHWGFLLLFGRKMSF